MSLEDKIKTTAKNIEGKVQEAVGELIGDAEIKAKGQTKQAEAEAEADSFKGAEEEETPKEPITADNYKKVEEIEQVKTFEGDNDQIEQVSSFEEAKERSSK